MDEKEKAQEIQEASKGQEQTQTTKEVKKEEAIKSPLEEARSLATSIEGYKEELKKLVEKHEKILADARLEGRSFAGQNQTASEEDRKKQEAMDFWKGTPVADAIKRYNQNA